MKQYPLTETQLGMILEWGRNRTGLQYNVTVIEEFPKSVDADRLAQAVEDALAAEEVYRMRFVETDDGVASYIDGSLALKVKRSKMSDAEAESHCRAFSKPFDIFGEPLVRFELIESPNAVRLAFDIFHALIDGTSGTMLLADISARYNGRAPAPRSQLSFTDYALAESAAFESTEYAAARAAAAERFSGRAMSVPEVSVSEPEHGAYLAETLELPRTAIDEYCARYGVHPNLFLMGVFARTLALFTNESSVVFWTVNHGRRGAELKDVHGCFVRMVPVLGELKAAETTVEYFNSFRLHQAGVYPFGHFCRDLGFGNGFGFVYQSGTIDYALELGGALGRSFTPMSGGASEIPALQAFGGERDFRLEMTCVPGRFDRAFLRRFLRRFAVIAGNFAAAGASRLDEVRVLAPEEHDAAVAEAYGGDFECDRSQTFLDRFARQVLERPESVAVVAGGRLLTYAELDRRSGALAQWLRREGVESGGFVGLKLPRTADFAVAVLAIQKCGAGYIPIDSAYPKDRVDYMLADSGAKLVLDETKFREAAAAAVAESPLPPVSPDLPAYMIYTSGSTGRPKGVVLPHRALAALCAWWTDRFAVGPGKRYLSITSFSFDASVPDLFAPLAAGAELHILSESERKDLGFIGDYCVSAKITGLTTSTQLGLALVNACPELPLEFMMLGGEKLVPFAKTPVKVINGYGPTEFAVCSSYHVVDQSRDYDYPIGRAVPNTWSFVVDRLGQLVPHGFLGEIALAGPQLADGYRRNPE